MAVPARDPIRGPYIRWTTDNTKPFYGPYTDKNTLTPEN